MTRGAHPTQYLKREADHTAVDNLLFLGGVLDGGGQEQLEERAEPVRGTQACTRTKGMMRRGKCHGMVPACGSADQSEWPATMTVLSGRPATHCAKLCSRTTPVVASDLLPALADGSKLTDEPSPTPVTAEAPPRLPAGGGVVVAGGSQRRRGARLAGARASVS